MLQEYARFYSLIDKGFISFLYDDDLQEIVIINHKKESICKCPDWGSDPLYDFLDDNNYELRYLEEEIINNNDVMAELEEGEYTNALNNFNKFLEEYR